jgi:hypothetical protein
VLTNAEYEAIMGTPTPVPTITPQGTVNPLRFQRSDHDHHGSRAHPCRRSMNGKEIGMVYNAGTVFTYLGSYTAPTRTTPTTGTR